MRSTDEIEYLKQLGENIRAKRVSLGYNQTEFANIIGKDQPSINRLENGKVNPGALYLRQIAMGLDTNIEDLLKKD